MNSRKWLALAITGGALTLGVAACGDDSESTTSGSDASGNLSGTVVVDGSSTVAPLTEPAGELFNEENPDVQVTVGTSGTGGGFEKFCVGETDISDASRLDAELARTEQRALDLAKLLTAIVSLANETRKDTMPVIALAVARLPATMDPVRGYVVLGHESRLGQVVRNLLDNARSFTAPGTRIDVRLRRVGSDVELRVEDQGPGIRPDNLERIFERFYTDRPEASFGSNSGLGLSISKQIVEAHKGRIWAENRLGKADANGVQPVLGARFRVRIPAVSDDWTPPAAA